MKKARWVSATVGTAGFALPVTAAFAAGLDGDGGVPSVLSGNSVNVPMSLPANVCGVAVTLNGGCVGGAARNTVSAGSGGSGGKGNADVASVGTPVNVCGMGGSANASYTRGSYSETIIPPSTPPTAPPTSPPDTGQRDTTQGGTVSTVTEKRHNKSNANAADQEPRVDKYFEGLLEASSLGTPAARRIGSSTPAAVVEDVRQRRRERNPQLTVDCPQRLPAVHPSQAS